MRTNRIILTVIFIIISSVAHNLFAQDLSKLSVNDRYNKLIEIARSVYKAPRLKNYYRDYGTPTITEMKTRNLSADERAKIASDTQSIWYGCTNNQKFYIVYFPYDSSKERFDADYATKVYIWENTGKAFAIGLGNMMMLPVRDGKIPDHDKQAEPVTYYSIAYSKDVPDAASLPKTAKYGDIITIKLTTVIAVADDGWTTEYGYNFDPAKDLTGGMVVSTKTSNEVWKNTSTTYQIMVTENMQVNITSYEKKYESW